MKFSLISSASIMSLIPITSSIESSFFIIVKSVIFNSGSPCSPDFIKEPSGSHESSPNVRLFFNLYVKWSATMSGAPPATQPIGRTFTKLTIAGTKANVDLVIPDDMPIIQVIWLAITQLREDSNHRWILEHPIHGPIDSNYPMGALELSHGETLYLRTNPAESSYQLSDDVADDITTFVESQQQWSSKIAREIGALILGIWCIAASIAWAYHQWTASLIAVLVLYAVLIFAALGAEQLEVHRSAMYLGSCAALMGPALGYCLKQSLVTDVSTELAIIISGLLLTAIITLMTVPSAYFFARSLTLAVTSVLALIGVYLMMQQFKVTVNQSLSIVILVGFLLLAFVVPLVISSSGLGQQTDRVALGFDVPRRDVEGAAETAQHDIFAIGFGGAVTISFSAYMLSSFNSLDVAAQSLAIVSLLTLVLYGATYSHPAHILAITTPALIGFAGVIYAQSNQQGVNFSLLTTTLVTAVFLGNAFISASTVSASRLRIFTRRLLWLGTASLIPLTLVLWNAYLGIQGVTRGR